MTGTETKYLFPLTFAYDIALALTEGDLGEARLGNVERWYLAFVCLADVGAKQRSQLAGLH
jgi:hypothetical protein